MTRGAHKRFSVPAVVSAVLLLVLSLWTAYLLMVSIAAKKNIRAEFAERRSALLREAAERWDAPSVVSEKIQKLAGRLFAKLEAKHTLLLLYLYIAECVVALLFFLVWYHQIRMEEFSKRIEEEKDRRHEVDELGLAAAGLAHETKNPLGVIRGLAQNIADDVSNDEKTREKARNIMEETDVTTARLGAFLSYAKFRSPTPEPVDACECLERIASLLLDDFANAGVALNTALVQVVIEADRDMLSQVVMNLLTNSLKFTPKKGVVTLSLEPEAAEFARIKVADTGAGIPAAILPEVFKPYVTKRKGGYGIGLAIVKRIADQAGWSIAIESIEGKGTTVVLGRIPVVGRGGNPA
ncbi:MAG: HAMP domain-containing histidine kinase [Kiritimatiellaeota bacterium]|nr:HAMP domain-containing histidine kinase [Kiritimatiellota bacterium]